jgi:hypothetical protein
VTGFADARAELAGKLAAAGVTNPTLNPAASPPCTLIGGARSGGRGSVGVGAWPAVIPVRILVPPPGDGAALAALEHELELVLRTLGYAEYTDTTYRHSTAGQDLPCYELAYPRDIPNPDC